MSKVTRKAIRGLALPGFLLLATVVAPQAVAQTVPLPATQFCGSATPGPAPPAAGYCTAPGVPAGCVDQPVCTENTASTGQTCGFARGATGCTANDFVGNAQVTSNTITLCQNNSVLTNQSLTFTIKSSSSTRYAPGLFIGEQNQPLNVAGGTCSVVTFSGAASTGIPSDSTPRTPFPWFNANTGDICGSYDPNFQSAETIDGVTFLCKKDPATGHPQLTFMVVYAQNAAGAAPGVNGCNGPADVHPGTTSKCTFGGTTIDNVTVTFNADPACSGKTVVFDPVAQTVTSTFTLVNNVGQLAFPGDSADGTTFEDLVPGPVVVRPVGPTGVTCTSADGAVCDLSATSGNDVKGTITTFPTGSHVTVTIVGDVSNPPPGPYTNTATLTPPGTLTAGANVTGNDSCTNFTSLPVKLQSFDVH